MTKRILTGLQVTADQFHLWNYFGAVVPFLNLCSQHADAEKFLFVANMHSLNSVQDGSLAKNTYNTLKLYLACGVDPDDVFIYNQSDIAAHAQLHWVLSSLTHMWFMERMHAYKAAVDKWVAWELGVGTFTYPILMAADILLYDATHVPTGKDQKQHVEFARDIAGKFNKLYGETFVLPDSVVQDEVAVVPGIDGRKMSKSYNNFLWLLDDEKTLLKKIKRIPTASLGIDDPKDPDTCHVYQIYQLFLDDNQKTVLRKRYTDGGMWYGDLKKELHQTVWSFVQPIQEHFAQISDEDIKAILSRNASNAREIAQAKIDDVYKKVWFSL